MKKMDFKEILGISLDIGEELLRCGAEISRVEDTITIICKSYGVKKIDVFVMNTVIIATIISDEKKSFTETRRVLHHKMNLRNLENLNSLSRKICKDNISRKKVKNEIKKCIKDDNPLFYLGGIITAFSFTLFFNGNLKDAIFSSIIAIILCLIDKATNKMNVNNLIYSFFCSFVIGSAAIILTKIIPTCHFDKIVIGDIMILIPGLSMFISVNDVFKGDTMSGIGRFTEGLFLTLCIAAGIGLSLFVLGGLL